MLRIGLLTWAACVAAAFASAATPFAESVVQYQPGTGFVAGYIHPSAALGAPGQPDSWGTPVDAFTPAWESNQVISLGVGGSLTVQLGSPVVNDPTHPYGLDFEIFGNTAFAVTNELDPNWNYIGTPATDGSLVGANPGSTRVSVSADGVTFYALNPSLTPVVDGLYPTDAAGDVQVPVNPSLQTGDFSGKTLAQIRSLYAGSAGGTGYDIAWAQDGNGQAVDLPSIQFVQVDVLSGKAEIDGFAVVPEPATVAIFGLALGLVLTCGMRSRTVEVESPRKS